MATKTYQQLKEELQEAYPMVKPYHYWVITSPYIYPSVSVYNDESTRVFDRGEPNIDSLNKINFEKCTIYQCDGKGGTDVEDTENEKGYPLSDYVKLPELETKTWMIRFVFDCTYYGSIYRTITCTEDNFSKAYKHELMLARRTLDLHYDEPSIMLSKEEITERGEA